MDLVTAFLVLKFTLPLCILTIVYSCNIYSKWSPTWYGIFTRRLPVPKEYPSPVGVGTSIRGWLNLLSIIQWFAIDLKGMVRGCSLDMCKQQRFNEGAHGVCRFRTDMMLRTVKKIIKYIASRHLIHLNMHNHLFCKGSEAALEEQWKCL